MLRYGTDIGTIETKQKKRKEKQNRRKGKRNKTEEKERETKQKKRFRQKQVLYLLRLAWGSAKRSDQGIGRCSSNEIHTHKGPSVF
jgi:hypothetical protein